MSSSTSQTKVMISALVVVLGGCLLVLLCSYHAPLDISLDGHRIDAAFEHTTWLITGYFLAVIGVLGYCLARFTERPGRRAFYTHGDGPQHLLLAAALAASVFCLIDLSLIHDAVKDAREAFWNYPASKDAVCIEVQGQQFEWHFRYAGPDGKFGTPDDVESNGILHVPVNKPVLLRIRSKDVVHSLFLPNVRLKQDAIPGRTNRLWFQATQTGAFELACAQLCGLGHYKMHGQFLVDGQAEFDKWLAQQSKEAAEEYDPTDKNANWGWDWEAR